MSNSIEEAIAKLNAARKEMTLVELIEDVESRHFRTNMDTGANSNALFVWNIVREYAGLPRITRTDLSQRHADDRGVTLEEQLEDERQLRQLIEDQRRL